MNISLLSTLDTLMISPEEVYIACISFKAFKHSITFPIKCCFMLF